MTSLASLPPMRLALTLVLVASLAAGCFGVPAGTADTGDSVTIRYTAYDLATGAKLRENRTATFSVGDGASGLGSTVERSLRGHRENETYEVVVRNDPSMAYTEPVEVNRTLASIPVEQSAPRGDFTQYVGEPSVGQTFPAYGIYTGQVNAITNDTVLFQILATDGQEDNVASVGAILVTHVTPSQLTRELKPNVGATFTIQPPSPFQPSTPLGLEPGSYKVVGATDTKLQYLRSASTESDLIGKDLRVQVTVVQVTAVEAPVPTGGNFGERHSPVVSGDPTSIAGGQALPSGGSGEHAHEGLRP